METRIVKRATGLAAALASGALLAAGCGGPPKNGVAQIGSTAATTNAAASSTSNPAAYSSCMRKHGVHNFPDPDSQGDIKLVAGRDAQGHRFGVDPDSAVFKAAQKACQKLAPNGGKPDPKAQAQELQAMLKFSACMRSHGVPKFPDPQVVAGGGMKMTLGRGMGVDPGSPQFKAAQTACQNLLPGGKGGPGGAQTIGPGKAP